MSNIRKVNPDGRIDMDWVNEAVRVSKDEKEQHAKEMLPLDATIFPQRSPSNFLIPIYVVFLFIAYN